MNALRLLLLLMTDAGRTVDEDDGDEFDYLIRDGLVAWSQNQDRYIMTELGSVVVQRAIVGTRAG